MGPAVGTDVGFVATVTHEFPFLKLVMDLPLNFRLLGPFDGYIMFPVELLSWPAPVMVVCKQ